MSPVHRSNRRKAIFWRGRHRDALARVVTAAGLTIDAYLHADLAGGYAVNPTGVIGQDTLFLLETAVAALAAAMVVLTGRAVAYGLAFATAVSALGAALLYRYVDVGTLGPLPAMYEPVWYSKKTVTVIAEAAAAAGAVVGAGLSSRADRERRH